MAPNCLQSVIMVSLQLANYVHYQVQNEAGWQSLVLHTPPVHQPLSSLTLRLALVKCFIHQLPLSLLRKS